MDIQKRTEELKKQGYNVGNIADIIAWEFTPEEVSEENRKQEGGTDVECYKLLGSSATLEGIKAIAGEYFHAEVTCVDPVTTAGGKIKKDYRILIKGGRWRFGVVSI